MNHIQILSCDVEQTYVQGASKIKLKKANKKRTVTVRRVINFNFISQGIHC
jgi:hypothetical protein